MMDREITNAEIEKLAHGDLIATLIAASSGFALSIEARDAERTARLERIRDACRIELEWRLSNFESMIA